MAILYTTHYMEEAERLCDRVAIIDEGVIKAEGTRRELVSMVGEKDRVIIDGGGDLTAAAEAARLVSGVTGASRSDSRIDVLADNASSILPELLARSARRAGPSPGSTSSTQPRAVFLHLTGKALRD
jgi:ABC-2 type transport system ATP-binding protein